MESTATHNSIVVVVLQVIVVMTNVFGCTFYPLGGLVPQNTPRLLLLVLPHQIYSIDVALARERMACLGVQIAAMSRDFLICLVVVAVFL